jgi:hypothetical protein
MSEEEEDSELDEAEDDWPEPAWEDEDEEEC